MSCCYISVSTGDAKTTSRKAVALETVIMWALTNTTVSVAESSLWSKSSKTEVHLLNGQMWSKRGLNSFVLGCKHFWSRSAIFNCSFSPFLQSHSQARNGPSADGLLTSYVQSVCSFTLSIFHFLAAGHSSTPSCTLCHLAHSLCWQPSRRSLIKHAFLHLRSYPWCNHSETRAPRTTLRFVFHGICDF